MTSSGQVGAQTISQTEVLRGIPNTAIYAGLGALRSWRERGGDGEREADVNLISEIYAAMRAAELNYRGGPTRTELI